MDLGIKEYVINLLRSEGRVGFRMESGNSRDS